MELQKIRSILSRLPFTEITLIALVVVCLYFLYSYSVSNTSLIEENTELREVIQSLRQAEVGDAVPPIETVDLQDRPIPLSFRDYKATVLIASRASCPFCVADFEVWNNLIAALRQRELNVSVLFFDPLSFTNETIPSNLTELRSVTLISSQSQTLRTYRAYTTPQISIISKDGVIVWTHVGRLSEDKMKELIIEASKYR